MSAPQVGTGVSEPLGKGYYTDPEVARREGEAIFFRTWQYLCHEGDLVEEGDYVTASVLDQDLAVIRQADGTLHGFYNVCAHRAHTLLEGRGNTRTITCPYHAWSYGLDGRLKRAPNSDRVAGFDAASICLTSVRVETLAGFVFVNLDPEAASLAETLGPEEEEIAAFAPEARGWRRRHHSTQHLACNWKVAVENYSECYHCAVAHPFLKDGVFDMASYRIETRARLHRHSCKGRAAENIPYAVDAAATPNAADFASWYLWPNFALEVYPGGYLDIYHWMPLGPGAVLQTIDWFAAPGTAAGDVERIGDLHLANTVAEDRTIVEAVQKGLGSRGYGSGALMIDRDLTENSEHAVRHFQALVLDALVG
jgi:phenylpropionate dioxygenase-like ring-hydroxylating dioxygenase large terminal subunit